MIIDYIQVNYGMINSPKRLEEIKGVNVGRGTKIIDVVNNEVAGCYCFNTA